MNARTTRAVRPRSAAIRWGATPVPPVLSGTSPRAESASRDTICVESVLPRSGGVERGMSRWMPPYLPMVDETSTSSSSESQANFYDCAPGTNESGPEVVYRFTIPTAGYFRADLTDGAGVDIDLHLLQNPSLSGGVVSGCIARNDSSIEIQNLAAGDYFLVADTYVTSAPLAGSYRVSMEWIPDNSWSTIPVADGITWKRMRTSELPGDVQTVQMVEVNRQVGWDVEASPWRVQDRPRSCTGVERIGGGSTGDSSTGRAPPWIW